MKAAAVSEPWGIPVYPGTNEQTNDCNLACLPLGGRHVVHYDRHGARVERPEARTLFIASLSHLSGQRQAQIGRGRRAQNGRRSSRAFDWPSDTVASKVPSPPPVALACLCPTQLAEGNLVPPRLRRRVSAVHKPPHSVPYAGARHFPASSRRRIATLRSRG